MASIEKKIDVDVPVDTAYNQWTQFEEFPRFMEGVTEVRQLDDSRLFWAADVAGEHKEWYARITRQVPDQVIAWESEGGAMNCGIVTFSPNGDKTEVQLHMDYEPADFKEQVGDVLGVVSRRVEGDLKRFKDFIENRGVETGGWRGEIGGGTATSGHYHESGDTTPHDHATTSDARQDRTAYEAGDQVLARREGDTNYVAGDVAPREGTEPAPSQTLYPER